MSTIKHVRVPPIGLQLKSCIFLANIAWKNDDIYNVKA